MEINVDSGDLMLDNQSGRDSKLLMDRDIDLSYVNCEMRMNAKVSNQEYFMYNMTR